MTELMKIAREMVKDGLKNCTEKQVCFFKRMYALNKDADIDSIVGLIPDSKIEWALEQVTRTVEKNRRKQDDQVDEAKR